MQICLTFTTYYSICSVQKFNIWPIQSFTSTENRDVTSESPGRES